MGFWDDLGAQVASKGKAISNKTKEVAGSTKLSYQIDQEKRKLQDAYLALGEAYYRDHAEDMPEAYGALAADCKALIEKINAMEMEKMVLTNQKKCCACGTSMANTDIFCPQCGAKNEVITMPEPEVPEETEEPEVILPGDTRFCPECGQQISAELLYCPNCGTKL